MPSPQLDVHTLGSAVPQSKPHSTVHVAEQPSSASASLSSHVSWPTMMPSPHTDSHVVGPHGTKVQSQPDSRDARTVQSLLHPSPLTVLPSSHASSDAWTLSPQLDVHTLGSAVPQSKPHSTVHVDEHPSSATESPSSHAS
jgi:hypothetical protein